MKTFCQFCKTEGHWGSECPRLKSTSHGTPRVETKQLSPQPRSAYETTPQVQRRPLAWGPKPKALNQGTNTTPTTHVLQSVDHPGSSTAALHNEIKSLTTEIKHLKHELAKRSVNNPVNPDVNTVNPVASVNKPKPARADMAAYMRKRRAEKAKTSPQKPD